jgi:hypothetical protein
MSGNSWHLEFIQLNALARGFQMLAAMGYQPGQGLGRGLAGQAAPIPVQLKAGRQGLGIEQNKKRKQQELEQQQKERGPCFAKLQLSLHKFHSIASAQPNSGHANARQP